MSTEERPGVDDPNDQEFDSLLRQSFQRESARSPGEPTQDCIETERLAAWSDGALPREEARAVEAHAAGCARCQALLAAFARSEPVVEPAPQPAVAGDGAVSELSVWRRWRIGWFVPVAATAAALAIWVATPSRPLSEEPRETAPPPASASSESVGAAPEVEARERFRSLPDSVPAAPRATLQARRAPATARSEPTSPAENPALGATAQKVENSAPPPAPVLAAELDAIGAKIAQSSNEAAAEARLRQASADAVAPRAALEDKQSPQVPTPAPPATDARVRVLGSGSAQTDLTLTNAGTYQWRLRRGARTTVEFSDSRGRQWTTVDVPADMLRSIAAGVAAGGRVCWLVGGRGMVLLTTDGVTFRRVPFPNALDLASVSAADAQRATVRAVDGGTFATADGGATWAAVQP